MIWSTPKIAFQKFVLRFLCHFRNCTEAGREELGDVKKQLYGMRLLEEYIPSVVSVVKKEWVGSHTLVAGTSPLILCSCRALPQAQAVEKGVGYGTVRRPVPRA